MRKVLLLAYGVYAGLLFALLALGALATLLVMPGLGRRRRIVRATARLFLRLAGCRSR